MQKCLSEVEPSIARSVIRMSFASIFFLCRRLCNLGITWGRRIVHLRRQSRNFSLALDLLQYLCVGLAANSERNIEKGRTLR